MAKKAIVDTKTDLSNMYGAPSDAIRVAEVVDEANVFEIGNGLEWVSCGDEVEADHYWYSPSTTSFTKFPLDIKAISYEGTTVTVTVNTEEGKEIIPSFLAGAKNTITMSGQVPSDFSGTFTVASSNTFDKFTYELTSEPSGECTTLGTVVKDS